MNNRVRKFVFLLFLLVTMMIILFLLIYNKNNSVVVVSVEGYNEQSSIKRGSGFVYKVSKYAYILTNYHVISGCDNLYIKYNDIKMKANLLNYDEYDDVAILIVDKKSFKNRMKFSNLKNYKNESIKIITKLNDIKMVDGIVETDVEPFKFKYNNVGKMLDLIKVRANIKYGYSGSPIVDKNNEVVGMLTMMDNDNLGYAYAIPASQLMEKVNILEHNSLYRPSLGINVSTSNDVIKGVILNNVFENYPAGDASLKNGDIIVGIDDIKIYDVLEFRYYLYKHNKDDVVKIKYYRDGRYDEVTIVLK